MTYVSREDMVARFGATEINRIVSDDAHLAVSLSDATALVDGFLAVAFTVPLEQVPPVILRLSCDIARYMLYVQSATIFITQRYEQALERLEDIVEGRLFLPDLSLLHKGRENVVHRVRPRVFGNPRGAIEGGSYVKSNKSTRGS